MNLGNLITLARSYVPAAKKGVVPDSTLKIVMNEGALDAAVKSQCLRSNTKIDITENIDEYSLSIKLTRYAGMLKNGIWWNDGDQWNKLDPITLKWLDNNRPNWRNDSSDDPKRYTVESDVLYINPPPDTTLSQGLHIYYAQKPEIMTSNNHYPFGHEREIPHLAILSEAILAYWMWKASYIVGTDQERVISKEEYDSILAGQIELLNKREDISNSRDAKFGGPRVC